MSNFNFNIERYYLLNGYEIKNNYISSCLLPYTDESQFNHEDIIREIKSILLQIDEKFHTRAYLLNIPVGYEKNANEDIKIYHELEKKLEYYCTIFSKTRKFQENGSFDFSEKQRAEHEKLLKPKTDSNGDIVEFTFDDWVNNKFISEKDYLGNYVLNNSENYGFLVSKGNMSFETWNKIQDAQEETYDILIEKTLKNSEDFLKINLKNQTDAKTYIEKLIYNQKEYFEIYKTVYDSVKFKTKHRGIKYGAKFITAKQYKERDKYQDLILAYYPRSYYEPLWNMIDISCEKPTKDQILYCQMEYRLKWVDYLEKYLLKEFSINKLNDLEKAFDNVNFEKTPEIFFSYAWDKVGDTESREKIVKDLYESLAADGMNVILDKENLDYKGSISEFMNKIGAGDFIVVAISDAYLKSINCMYEFYEIYKNSKQNKELMRQRIFPIRVESISLSKPSVLETYFDYWEELEKEWAELIVKKATRIGAAQQTKYKKIQAIASELGDFLDFLSDINSKTKEELSKDNFKEIKEAIKIRMKD